MGGKIAMRRSLTPVSFQCRRGAVTGQSARRCESKWCILASAIRGLALACALSGMMLPPAVAQQKLPIDNFAPATDDDIKALDGALARIPACTAIRCPSFSCPAMGSLWSSLKEADVTISVLDSSLGEALHKYEDLLDRFQQEYRRLTQDDKRVRVAQVLSRAFLTLGKLYLTAASMGQWISSSGDLYDKLEDPDAATNLVGAVLALDRITEGASNIVSTIDTLAQSTGGPARVASDDIARLQTQKGVISDILSAISAHADALRALARARQAGNPAAIAEAAQNARRLAGTRGSLGQLLGKLLAAVAEAQLDKLADRLSENLANEAALDEAWRYNYGNYIRLVDRKVGLTELRARIRAAQARTRSCALTCAESATTPVSLPGRGNSYGDWLRLYNPRVGELAAAIAKALAGLALKPGYPATVKVNPTTVMPLDRTIVAYDVPQCVATEGAKLQVSRLLDASSDKLLQEAGAETGGPKSKSLEAPEPVGNYEVRIVDRRGVKLAAAPLKVEIPQAVDRCGITLRRGIFARDRDHLAPKQFPFVLGNPGERGYLKGSLTITPGIHCFDGRLAFPVFGGVSRQAEYFQVHLDAGDIRDVTYPEQWFAELRVRFDTGAIETSIDGLLGVKIPPGAKGVSLIAMKFVKGNNAKTLEWQPD
jgi:hypothetical protein